MGWRAATAITTCNAVTAPHSRNRTRCDGRGSRLSGRAAVVERSACDSGTNPPSTWLLDISELKNCDFPEEFSYDTVVLVALTGLRAIAVSAAALATAIGGTAALATATGNESLTVVAVPAAETPTAIALARDADLSRDEVRPAIGTDATARADVLASTVQQIAQHDTEVKAQAAADAAAKAAALARFKAEQGYEPGTKSPKEIARQIAANTYGWGDAQFACYDNIIMRESRWNPLADNPTSSAYGIPQALPGSRMATFGADWRTNPATQIKWGLDYVKERYGTPCSAWAFKRSHGWY